jgi:hypothetical protein
MPANAMSQALKLHNTVLRALIREHRGYESATEGDSFIIAFPTPAQALA